jgi:hypothetical protein
MSEILNWITSNQALLIVAIVAFAVVANKFIGYKAKSNPAHDRWDDWAPTSQRVTNMIFQGAKWWGDLKAKSGDAKLQHYLQKLDEYQKDYQEDKLRAMQKLIAWYLDRKEKVPTASPSTDPRQIGQDDPAV